MITLYTASSDTTITNRQIGNSLNRNAQYANFGHGAFVETFAWTNRLSGSSEEARILLKLPFSQGDLALSSRWYLHMHTVATSEGAPSDFSLDIKMLTGSWDAGHGIDDFYTQEGAGASWLSASNTLGWGIVGGDLIASPKVTEPFASGLEHLDADISSLMTYWTDTLGLGSPLMLGVQMASSSEAFNDLTKVFWSAEGPHADLKPQLRLHAKELEADDTRLSVIDETSTFTLRTFDRDGAPVDLGDITAKVAHAGGANVTAIDAVRLRSGSHQVSFAVTAANNFTASTGAQVVWILKSSGAPLLSSSSFSPSARTFGSWPGQQGSERKIPALGTMWGGQHKLGDVVRFDISWFESTFPQTYVLTNSAGPLTTALPHRNLFWRLRNLNRDQTLLPFYNDDEHVQSGRVPYGEDRNYLQLSMQGLEPGASYQVDFLRVDGNNQEIVELDGAVFRIEE